MALVTDRGATRTAGDAPHGLYLLYSVSRGGAILVSPITSERHAERILAERRARAKAAGEYYPNWETWYAVCPVLDTEV
jgi:hypothetical protein